MSGVSIVGVLLGGGLAILACRSLVARGLGARFVTLRIWVTGFAVLVVAGRWVHSHAGAHWPLAQLVIVGAGVVLTGLWFNEPDATSRRR